MSEDQEKRRLGLLAFGGESRERDKAEGGNNKEGDAVLFTKESTPGMVQVLRVENSVSRYQRNLEGWGSQCRKSCWFCF